MVSGEGSHFLEVYRVESKEYRWVLHYLYSFFTRLRVKIHKTSPPQSG
jgi:uncharacterized protein YpiB (UPF0302 family)